MTTRREFLSRSIALSIASSALGHLPALAESEYVNDIHSQLNRTRVARIVRPTSISDLRSLIQTARRDHSAISVAGGRHAMGGQQFGTDTTFVDMTSMNHVLNLDPANGLLQVEGGIEWPQLIDGYLSLQKSASPQWGIAQKQTGADRISVGGTIAANGHGRGLKFKPFASDVDSLLLLDPQGREVHCSRTENPELFRLVCGGYGLFGIVAQATLRLRRRQKLERVVEVRGVEGLVDAFNRRIADGFLYGDFQFSIERDSNDFLSAGVFSCYRPVSDDTPMSASQKELGDDNWRQLLYLAHADQKRAFDVYSKYYLSTNGQIYWSDTHQFSIYPDNYHREIDAKLRASVPSTEIITEIDVPRDTLADFFAEVREDFRKNKVDLIYGTVRLIEKDDDSFLPWAKQPYACTVMNLHTPHSPEGIKHSAEAFRRLIDMAVRRGGSYFLTYHRYARREQVEACYPQFAEFLRKKREYDPEERFQSDWYRHYRQMFGLKA